MFVLDTWEKKIVMHQVTGSILFPRPWEICLPKHTDELLSFSQNSEAQDPVLVGLQVSF